MSDIKKLAELLNVEESLQPIIKAALKHFEHNGNFSELARVLHIAPSQSNTAGFLAGQAVNRLKLLSAPRSTEHLSALATHLTIALHPDYGRAVESVTECAVKRLRDNEYRIIDALQAHCDPSPDAPNPRTEQCATRLLNIAVAKLDEANKLRENLRGIFGLRNTSATDATLLKYVSTAKEQVTSFEIPHSTRKNERPDSPHATLADYLCMGNDYTTNELCEVALSRLEKPTRVNRLYEVGLMMGMGYTLADVGPSSEDEIVEALRSRLSRPEVTIPQAAPEQIPVKWGYQGFVARQDYWESFGWTLQQLEKHATRTDDPVTESAPIPVTPAFYGHDTTGETEDVTVSYKSKYDRNLKSETVDVYDVLKAFEVKCPALQHLIKKALCVGIRGHKDASTDLNDILESAKRAVQLGAE